MRSVNILILQHLSFFHFLLAPNHIDVTTPDSREQGVMAGDGMTLRGVTRCHHDEPDTAPGPRIIFQWRRIPHIAAITNQPRYQS